MRMKRQDQGQGEKEMKWVRQTPSILKKPSTLFLILSAFHQVERGTWDIDLQRLERVFQVQNTLRCLQLPRIFTSFWLHQWTLVCHKMLSQQAKKGLWHACVFSIVFSFPISTLRNTRGALLQLHLQSGGLSSLCAWEETEKTIIFLPGIYTDSKILYLDISRWRGKVCCIVSVSLF